MDRIKCSKCKGKNGPPIGMLRWPTENDEYVCPACIRKHFADVVEAGQAQLDYIRWSIPSPGILVKLKAAWDKAVKGK